MSTHAETETAGTPRTPCSVISVITPLMLLRPLVVPGGNGDANGDGGDGEVDTGVGDVTADVPQPSGTQARQTITRRRIGTRTPTGGTPSAPDLRRKSRFTKKVSRLRSDMSPQQADCRLSPKYAMPSALQRLRDGFLCCLRILPGYERADALHQIHPQLDSKLVRLTSRELPS